LNGAYKLTLLKGNKQSVEMLDDSWITLVFPGMVSYGHSAIVSIFHRRAVGLPTK